MSLALSKYTNLKGPLTKEMSLDADGVLVKHARTTLYDGRVDTLQPADLEAFGDLLVQLKHNEALGYGLCRVAPSARVVSSRHLSEAPGAVSRTKDYFQFARTPGVLMLDHDSEHVAESLDRDSLREALLDAVPELELAPMLWRPSASSFIYDTARDVELQGLRGQRLYIPVQDGSDIKRLGSAIYERLWAAGRGRFVVSGSGLLLDRNLFDNAVWHAEGLDFAAGAKCLPPLEQRRGPPHIWEAGLVGGLAPFDSRVIGDISPEIKEAADKHRDAARESMREAQSTARAVYLAERAPLLAARRAISLDAAHEVFSQALDRNLLFPDFLLHLEDGTVVSVGEVLDNPAKYHGKRCGDPLEPDYRGDSRIARINLYSGSRPCVESFAHGGAYYKLVRQPRVLRVQPGENPRLVDECLSLLRIHGDLFDFGDKGVVRAAGERLYPVDATYLTHHLGRDVARFEKYLKTTREWVGTNCPDELSKTILSMHGERELPKLTAVITAPTMRANGTILDAPGFDAETGLLYLFGEPSALKVPTSPDKAAVAAALAELWAPFELFPFAGPVDRGVMLAALFTAVVRRALPTAPGFAFDAPAAGSGKTRLAHCLAALGGHQPASFAPPPSDDELRKTLFAALREGAGSVLLDNLIAPLGGAALNQFLTEPHYSSRILGISENQTVPNTSMFVVTGNNLAFIGDTCRRILPCRIDAESETPYLRRFEFDPLDLVRSGRHRLVVAVLTLLRAYQAAGAPVVAAGSLASFERWDGIVRQAVCWLAQAQDQIELGDPAASIASNVREDSHKSSLRSVLEAWRDCFGERAVSAQEVLDHFGDEGLEKALRELESQRGGGLNAQRLGKWLSRHKDEFAGGLRFVRVVNAEKCTLWRAVGAK